MTQYLFSEEYTYDEKAVRKKLQKEGVRDILLEIADIFRPLKSFDQESTDNALHRYIETSGRAFGAVMSPLRIAVSGVQSGPDLFPMLAVLGRERVLERIDRTIKQFLS
jgi:glutamyl-tRNA synthetase